MSPNFTNKLGVAAVILSIISSFFIIKASASQFPPLIISEINHLVANNEEWIEIKNNSETTLELSKLKLIENNTKHKIEHANRTTINPGEIIIIANNADFLAQSYPSHLEQIFDSTWQNLSTEGEELALEYDNTIYDQIIYPKTSLDGPETKTLARSSELSFSLKDPTPFADDVQINDSNEDTSSNQRPKEAIALITELNLSESPGYIELYIEPDKIDTNLNLKDWQLKSQTFTYTFSDQSISSGQYFLIPYSHNSLTSDSIQLLSNKKDLLDEVCWSKNATNNCLNLNTSKTSILGRISFFDSNLTKDWTTFEHKTPTAHNEHKNYTPVSRLTILEGSLNNYDQVTLKLSANLSSDEDLDPLSYAWYLDGKLQNNTTTYSSQISTLGQHLITLTVSDPFGGTSQSYIQANVLQKPPVPTSTQPLAQTCTTTTASSTKKETTSFKSNEQNLSTKIQIHSILANPSSNDTGKEWIKIINQDDKIISLNNWQLDDEEGGSKPYTILNLEIAPQQIINFLNSDTKINLNNAGDEVRLIDPQGNIISTLTYEKAEDDEVIAATSNSLSSLDPENPTTSSSSKKLVASTLAINQQIFTNGNLSDQVHISEIFPNPKDSDTNNEWLEFENVGTKAVNLGNWYLQIKDKAYRLPPSITIPPLTQLKFNPAEIKLTLGNSNTQIAFYDFNSSLKQDINYEKASEGQSYSLIKDHRHNLVASLKQINSSPTWQWTKHITPGAPNPELITIKGQLADAESNLVNNQLALENDQGKLNINFETTQIPSNQLNLLKSKTQIILEALAIGQEYFLEKIINIVPLSTPGNKSFGPQITIFLLIISLILIAVIPYTRNWILNKSKLLLTNILKAKSST